MVRGGRCKPSGLGSGMAPCYSGRTTDGQRIGVVAVQSRVARLGNGAAKVAIICCTQGHLRLLPAIGDSSAPRSVTNERQRPIFWNICRQSASHDQNDPNTNAAPGVRHSRIPTYLCKSRSSLSHTDRGTEKILSQCCPIVGRLHAPSLRSTGVALPRSSTDGRGPIDLRQGSRPKAPTRHRAASSRWWHVGVVHLGTTGLVVGEVIQGNILPCLHR